MTELAREYGEGLYDLAVEENMAGDLLAQLRVLDTTFKEQPDFCRLLSNRALGQNERLGILDSTLGGQVAPYLLNFLKLLCERGILNEFAGCVAVYTEHYNQDNNIAVATVTTSAPLSESQRQRLIEKLKAMTGKGISLVEKLDASVLGGVMLELDGKRYDNTVKSRLESIHEMLVKQ